MAKRYKSVLAAVQSLIDDRQFQEEFEQQVASKQLSKTLFAMRCRKGFTQSEMAEKLGCTQSRVSKIENTVVEKIRVSDIVAYTQVLDMGLSINFRGSTSAVDCVKFHAFQIKKYLDDLAEMAHRDDDVLEGVKKFYIECLHNVLVLIKNSADKLPKARKLKRPLLEVCAPEGAVEDELLETK